MMKDSVFVS